MKKNFFLILALVITGLSFGQYYPNQGNYPNQNYPNNNGDYQNNGYNNQNYEEDWYGDDFYNQLPDDYYNDYPQDYYSNSYYQNYYNDYRNSIVDINWNQFFIEFRLSPFQVRQIVYLNSRFSNYRQWNSFYFNNPDRWYYDRFYALERILGPRIYITFYQTYYNNYNPIVYFQNYRRQHYYTTNYVMPKYRKMNTSGFRRDRSEFSNGNHYGNNNSHGNSGFRDNVRTTQNGGFRNVNTTTIQTPRNQETTPRNNGGFRSETPPQVRNNSSSDSGNRSGGFRSERNEGNRNASSNSGNRSGGFRASRD